MRSLFLVSATSFWLLMMSQLIHREYFMLTPVQNVNQVLSLENPYLRQEYRAIYLSGQRAGFNFNVLEPLKNPKPGKFYELRHNTYLSFLFLGHEREMSVKGSAWLDQSLALSAFQIKITSGDSWTQIRGRVKNKKMLVIIEGKTGSPVRKVLPVGGTVFFSESLNFIWTPDNLKLGKTGRLQIWNPLQLTFQTLDFHVRKRTRIPFDGRSVEVMEVAISFGEVETKAWVTPEGVVIREETPTGLTLQKEEAWKIFDAMREKRSSPPDLPNLFSVASNLKIPNPTALRFMKAKVTTPDSEKIYEIKISDLSKFQSAELPINIGDPELAAALESNAWVQVEDPMIRKQSEMIVGSEKKALRAALRILMWVHQNMTPTPTVTPPQATQVLATLKGDCNEYTVLFTALARAAGIPTRMVAGLVYQNGRFFYHAWPIIYVGKWIPVDPTFDQAPADATHLPLIEGDFEEQLELASKVGNLKVAILEAK